MPRLKLETGELERSMMDLTRLMKDKFAQPEYIPGCEILDITNANEYSSGNGWIEAFCGAHNNQRVRYKGNPAEVQVGDFVDVEYFPNHKLFEVRGAGYTTASNINNTKVSKLWKPDGTDVSIEIDSVGAVVDGAGYGDWWQFDSFKVQSDVDEIYLNTQNANIYLDVPTGNFISFDYDEGFGSAQIFYQDSFWQAPATLPVSPAAGQIAIDSGDSNTLKWYDGSDWQTAGGGLWTSKATDEIYYFDTGVPKVGIGDFSSITLGAMLHIVINSSNADALIQTFDGFSYAELELSNAAGGGEAMNLVTRGVAYVGSYFGLTAASLSSIVSAGGEFLIGTSDTESLHLGTKSLIALTIDGGQKVGIGTTTPSVLFHMKSTGYLAMRIDGVAGLSKDLGFASSDSLRWLIRSNSTAEAGSDVGSDLQIMSRTDAGAAKSTVMHFERSTGRVGIGNTGPAFELDVTGDVASDDLYLRDADSQDDNTLLSRLVNGYRAAPADHFGDGSFTGFTWATYTGFVTPANITEGGSGLGSIVRIANTAVEGVGRAFGYLSSFSNISCRCSVGQISPRTGIRMDDGTDNNYVELFLSAASSDNGVNGVMGLYYRYAIGGAVTGPTQLWNGTTFPVDWAILRLIRTGDNVFMYARIGGAIDAFQGTATITGWTPSRCGIYHEHVGAATFSNARASLFDWVDNS